MSELKNCIYYKRYKYKLPDAGRHVLVVRVAGELVQHLLDLGGGEAGQQVLDVHVRRVEDVATEGDSAGHLDQRQLRISETGAKSNIADVDSSLCFPDRPFVFVLTILVTTQRVM